MKIQNGLLNKVLNKRELELETFDLIDILSPTYTEDIEEYKQKAASLEMDVSKGIIPFPELNSAEVNTWETYCPNKTEVRQYKGVVPIQVMRLLTEVQNRKFFNKVEIWSENKEDIDPIVVGVLTDSYSSPKYLLARWGLSLRPYEEIRDMAKKIWLGDRKTDIEHNIKKSQRALEDLEKDCSDFFNGRYVFNF